MSVLSWGKPTFETSTSTNGKPAEVWKELPTPKEDTLKLTPTAGTDTDATEEGGDLVDTRRGKNSYSLEFDLFVKKGEQRPWEDNDGKIDGEHAFRITPEDEACEGIQIDRAKLSVEENYTTADGILLHYVARCLKPAVGKTVKPYTKGA